MTLSNTAIKQLNIEKSLDSIQTHWDNQAIDICTYKEYSLINTADDLYALLDEHQVILMSLKNSPYFSVFEESVTFWIKKLGDICESLDLILFVQKQWLYLETIFVGHEDIRRQLPEETMLFDNLNNDWINTMARLTSFRIALRGLTEFGLLGIFSMYII